ncbi:MAG: response regulator [Candidatus Omnitrophica bacterium]|nr:response regulator [Candidatus Omnitrophota bacterium]
MFKHILVVSGDLELRDLLYNVLINLNYKVTTILAFDEIIEMLNKEKLDCIIIDIDTQDFKREPILKEIRKNDNRVKVIGLISGSIEETMGEEPLVDNRIHLLKKDADTTKLVQSILEILKEKQAEKELKREEVLQLQFTGNILIVDDEEEAICLVSGFLHRKGYVADIALSGEEALLKFKTNRPKVVILDILMPGMDGLLVLKQIKELDSSVLVIITSAIQDDKVIKETKELGAAAYLIKPFSLEKLEGLILSSASANRR